MSSKSTSSTTTSSGIGFGGLLTILFIGLKLTNYIDWSWWWVLSPLWLPLAVILGFVALCGAVVLICERFK
jgi:transmembrane Fragile-X-F protein